MAILDIDLDDEKRAKAGSAAAPPRRGRAPSRRRRHSVRSAAENRISTSTSPMRMSAWQVLRRRGGRIGLTASRGEFGPLSP